MTPMSRSEGGRRAESCRKWQSCLALPTVARRLLRFGSRMARVLAVGALVSPLGLGCVLPADLEPAGADAGPSSPPVILSANPPEYAFPGPIVVSREDPPVMVLDAIDNDVGDSLYVRLYVDYGRPEAQPAYGECQVGPDAAGSRQRTIRCQTNALCNPVRAEDTSNHVLEAMIADREFLAMGAPGADLQPAFRGLTDWPNAGYSLSSWVMQCGAPQ